MTRAQRAWPGRDAPFPAATERVFLAAMPMIETLRSGVNSWECDHMGHMNVRYYFARASQGLSGLALRLGLSARTLRQRSQALRVHDQHVRFLKELRPGAAYTLSSGVLRASGQELEVYQELRSADGERLCATMLSVASLRDSKSDDPVALGEEVLRRVPDVQAQLPGGQFERGVPRAPSRTHMTHERALSMGLVGAYLAPVMPEDCDDEGAMTEAAFMARVSDGIGHFFSRTNPPGAPVGGAALEYRYLYHRRPRAGDLIEVRSGLKALGRKTRAFCNFIFDVETGECVARSEAVAVYLDLQTRRALPIPEDARAQMQSELVPDLAL